MPPSDVKTMGTKSPCVFIKGVVLSVQRDRIVYVESFFVQSIIHQHKFGVLPFLLLAGHTESEFSVAFTFQKMGCDSFSTITMN